MKEPSFRGRDFKGNWIEFNLYSLNMLRVGRIETNTISQFTGMRDKKRVKIYEDDIVRVSDFGYNVKVGKIVYNEKAALYQVVAPLFICALGCYADGTVDIEVIGNIHDNPEMAEGL